MKNVFSSQSQMCHVWAQQTQDIGRASSIFFEGTDIYSYGYHYLAAKIHTVKGKTFALVRSDTYGPATSGHLAQIRNSLQGLMPFFCVPDVNNPKAAIKILDKQAQDFVASHLRTVKVSYKEQVQYALESIEESFTNASNLREILELKPIKFKVSDIIKIRTHYAKRLERYKELNTPEAITKREIETEKRKVRKAKLDILKHQEKIEAFRKGQTVGYLDLDYELLRIQGDEVVTSRGARVPLRDATLLYHALETGKDVLGQTVGNFRVVSIRDIVTPEFQDDKIVKIGCHEILLSEAKNVLSLKVA